MMKILIIGDSSVLPREELIFPKTYYSLLKKTKNYILEMNAITNNTSGKIVSSLDFFMLYGYEPDIVILNYGIVDVYPRPYPNKLNRFFSCTGLLPYMDTFLKKTRLYYKLGDMFNFKEVSLREFETNSRNIVKQLLEKSVRKVIILGIIRPDKTLLKSKKIVREVKLYNDVYIDLAEEFSEVEYIDMYNESQEAFTIWDGYHYSEEGSENIARKLETLIRYD